MYATCARGRNGAAGGRRGSQTREPRDADYQTFSLSILSMCLINVLQPHDINVLLACVPRHLSIYRSKPSINLSFQCVARLRSKPSLRLHLSLCLRLPWSLCLRLPLSLCLRLRFSLCPPWLLAALSDMDSSRALVCITGAGGGALVCVLGALRVRRSAAPARLTRASRLSCSVLPACSSGGAGGVGEGAEVAREV